MTSRVNGDVTTGKSFYTNEKSASFIRDDVIKLESIWESSLSDVTDQSNHFQVTSSVQSSHH